MPILYRVKLESDLHWIVNSSVKNALSERKISFKLRTYDHIVNTIKNIINSMNNKWVLNISN